MELKPQLIKQGNRRKYEMMIMKKLGDIYMVGRFSDPYEPPNYRYFDNQAEAETLYEQIRVETSDEEVE